jgi:hypothetical protein
MTRERRGARRPALVAVLGGAAIVASSFLTWVDAGGGVSVGTVSVTGTPKGNELLLGQVALGAGIAVVVFGLLLLVFGRARRLFGLLVLVGGIVAIATAAYVASTPRERYVDFGADTGAPAGQVDEVRASLTNLFSVSGLTADPGIGSYVAIGGGAVAALGGLSALLGRRRSKRVAEAEAEASTPPSSDLEEITDTPIDQGPASPVRETPEPAADALEEPPATPQEPEPAPVEAPTSPEEPPHEEPPAQDHRNRDEWSF